MMYRKLGLFWNCLFLLACNASDDGTAPVGMSQLPPEEEPPPVVVEITDEELLDITQRETFRYFWEFAEENSG